MKKHALMVIPVAVVALLAVGLAPPRAVAQPQPTMILSPSSGPCDGTVEVEGSGFPVTPGQGKSLSVYLLRPGTTDVNMALLVPGYPGPDGAFSQWAGLWQHGCEAAVLDSQSDHPAGYLAIAAAPQEPTAQPGERIPNIMAVAQYTYTTTTPPPPPVMVISPSSGPCDATVELTGTGFQPGQAISLGWAYPSSEAPLGTLASVTADAQGAFIVRLTLGETGCRAARTWPHVRDPEPPTLRIDAEAIGPPVQVGSALARAWYVLTTTDIGGTPPQALPVTGGGPGRVSRGLPWVAVIAAVAAVGVTLVAASLVKRRTRS
jgi:hypothetical protein